MSEVTNNVLPMTGKSAMQDLKKGALQWRIWTYLSWNDTRTRYRRTFLGPWWMVLGNGISLTLMCGLWSTLFNLDWRLYLPHIIVGFITWQWLSSYVTGACELFTGASSALMNNIPLPVTFHVYRYVNLGLIQYLHYLPLYVIAALIVGQWPHPLSIVLVPAAFLIILMNAIWVSLFLGILAARFRDISPLISAIIAPMMMLTPVIWDPAMLGDLEYLADFNPFTHFIAIVREPLLGRLPSMLNWGVTVTFLVLGSFVTMTLFRRCRNSIVFWT